MSISLRRPRRTSRPSSSRPPEVARRQLRHGLRRRRGSRGRAPGRATWSSPRSSVRSRTPGSGAPTRSPVPLVERQPLARVHERHEQVLGHPVDRRDADARQSCSTSGASAAFRTGALPEEQGPERGPGPARAAPTSSARWSGSEACVTRGLAGRAGERAHPAATGRQHDRRAREQRRPHEVKPRAEHAVAGPEVDERRRPAQRGREPGRGVDDAPRRARGPRGEQDERRGVARGAADARRHRRAGRGAACRRADDARRRPARRRERRRVREPNAPPRRDGRRTRDPAIVATPPSITTARRRPAVRQRAAKDAGARPGSSTTTHDPRPQRREQPGDPVRVLAHAEGDGVPGREPGPRERAGVRAHAFRERAAGREATRPFARRGSRASPGRSGATTRSSETSSALTGPRARASDPYAGEQHARRGPPVGRRAARAARPSARAAAGAARGRSAPRDRSAAPRRTTGGGARAGSAGRAAAPRGRRRYSDRPAGHAIHGQEDAPPGREAHAVDRRRPRGSCGR